MAPGARLLTTTKWGGSIFSDSIYSDNFGRTSGACANASGVCALILSLDSNLRWDSVRTILNKTADKVGTYTYTSSGPLPNLGNTWNNEMGYGKVNAYNALKYVGTTSINQNSSAVPNTFYLFQNYPNPFNPVTKIKFDIPLDARRETREVKLIVYDALGREVITLVNEKLSPGSYEVDFDGSNFSSGVYFYKLETELNSETKKMLILK